MRRVALLEHLLLVAGVLPSLVSGFSRPLAVIPKMQLQKATVPKTIVITGANSGIGRDAARKFSKLGHNVYVACRTEARAKQAAKETGAAGYFACDLSSLSSVQGFAKAWGSSTPIDVLCLNAGLAPNTRDPAPQFTEEGFEMTIGVNHLAHFVLAEKLLPNLEKSKLKNPRLVVTASSVHDPDTPGGNIGPGATLGDMSGLDQYLKEGRFEMVDGQPYSPDKAYKDSKLCNVLFTQELTRRLKSKNSKVKVNCFSPGLIPSSGLFRSQNFLFRTIFDFVATNIIRVAATVDMGGDTLVYMAESPELEGVGGRFYATAPGKPRELFAERPISVEASDANKAKRLWDLSAKMIAKATASAGKLAGARR